MSWSVVVNDVQSAVQFPTGVEEQMASQHPAYPRDMNEALKAAKAAGLQSATLTGCRTPNPYGDDEVVDISIRGFATHSDFIAEMRRAILSGPDESAASYKHYAALARIRDKPCSHIFAVHESIPGARRCAGCGVVYAGGLFYFDEDEI